MPHKPQPLSSTAWLLFVGAGGGDGGGGEGGGGGDGGAASEIQGDGLLWASAQRAKKTITSKS